MSRHTGRSHFRGTFGNCSSSTDDSSQAGLEDDLETSSTRPSNAGFVDARCTPKVVVIFGVSPSCLTPRRTSPAVWSTGDGAGLAPWCNCVHRPSPSRPGPRPVIRSSTTVMINGSSTSWFSKGDVVVVLLLGSKEIDLENRAHRPERRARPRSVSMVRRRLRRGLRLHSGSLVAALAGLDRVATRRPGPRVAVTTRPAARRAVSWFCPPAGAVGAWFAAARPRAGARRAARGSLLRGRVVVCPPVPFGVRAGGRLGCLTDLHPGAVTTDVVPVPVRRTRPARPACRQPRRSRGRQRTTVTRVPFGWSRRPYWRGEHC